MHKVIAQFNGGISQNSKSGLPNSVRFAKNLNIYSDDDSVSLNPIPVKVSGAVVVDLIKWMTDVFPSSTDKYAVGDQGNIYKITSSEVWSLDRSGATVGHGAAGQGLGYLPDAMYYATATTLGRKNTLSGTPTYDDDVISNGVDNVDVSVTASGQTYTTPAAISETATNEFIFQGVNILTKDPIKAIALFVTSKGTGDWTITLHDSLNNTLGTATIVNASLTNGAMNTFTFATPLRINLGSINHIHVTSTVANGTLQTSTLNDLSTAQLTTYFGILIGDTQYHPIAQHTNGVNGTIVIGNGNYIAELTSDASSTSSVGGYLPNKIEITPGYNIRFFARQDEMIIAFAWKGTTVGAYEDGKMFFWDGISPYYNSSLPVTSGSPNAAINFKNRILAVLGTNAHLTLNTQPFNLIQPAPLLTPGTSIEVLPGAITTWQNRAHIGIGANSTDGTGVHQGVYEFGNQSDRSISYTSVSSEVLNLGYIISTGDELSVNMKIGCVYGQGTAMYISWQSDAFTYGVDKVTKNNNPAATGIYESLIDDNTIIPGTFQFSPAPQKQKEAKRLTIKYNTLPVGCTVTPKYKIDRGSWVLGTGSQIGIAGTTECEMQINARYYEIEYGFELAATVNYPIITGIYYSFNPLIGERNND